MPFFLTQTFSMVGAVMILVAIGGSQYAGLRNDGVTYGLLNLAGSSLLAISALSALNLGVVVLESTRAVLSLGILIRRLRGPGASHPPSSGVGKAGELWSENPGPTDVGRD